MYLNLKANDYGSRSSYSGTIAISWSCHFHIELPVCQIDDNMDTSSHFSNFAEHVQAKILK